MYRVLRPHYIRTGEIREDGKPYVRVEWIEMGRADSLEQAKERFGGQPVLEKV
jgi:hypothetical protein